ncbi:DUF948 domain-containing protein [Oceanobacillus halophilus]|uniref:DUF948 domain-containing protein n=1 Tax=Oceanobacillus halophilus TaxID=930130 RepID=A0A494ZZ93_9BACI|nr:DUF948 domain-containing protein [Oceanobacillus halophilus]RKQ32276.1 DUF948 domain-containing protein [Oceanobacillus halophilus]
MLWLGIGVMVIGVALLILTIVLIKPLFKLAGVLGSLHKTTETLPQTVNELTTTAKDAIGTGVDTLNQVNTQMKELSPIFYIIGDVGRATNQLSSSIVSKVEHLKETTETTKDVSSNNNLQGFYGLIALAYLLFRQK